MRGHEDALRALGLREPGVVALSAYLDVLTAWSRRVNLTGAVDAGARVRVLVEPALRLRGFLVPGRLLDVGSGNGSPGLVLALLEPGRPATLLEPRSRRWAFLREAARAAGRPEIEVLRCRHDGYGGPPAANLSLRAVRLSLPALAPLVAPGGRLLVLGAPPDGDRCGLEQRPTGQPDLHVFERPAGTDVPRET